MIIRPDDVPEEIQAPRPLVLKRYIRRDTHGPNVSVTWVRIAGHHERIANPDSDRVYYVLKGFGRFQVGDGAPIDIVSDGDLVFVPHGTPYEFDGEMTYLVINGPAFTPGSDRVLPSALP
jgi:mannose-6-phosphate isomerase-like protein (cupin superfamily)